MLLGFARRQMRFQPVGEPVEQERGALDAVHRAPATGELVGLAGEAVEGHVLAEQLHRDPQFLGLADRAAQVLLAALLLAWTVVHATT